jgi:glycosyltransferase involved in cell wall biosynthesis
LPEPRRESRAGPSPMTRPVIALLGRKDVPTDAVEEYCRYLGDALKVHEFQLQIRRVPWELHGWRQSLRALHLQSAAWRDTWVLVQYTALAWSARGFPLKFPRILRVLKSAGARVAVVFHDVEPFTSTRPIDRLRHRVQMRTMRRALDLADTAIFTVPPENLSWLKTSPSNAAFVPVGANLPFQDMAPPRSSAGVPTVGVFSITGGEQGARETQQILAAVQQASRKLGPVRLSIFGRHSELREEVLRQGLQNFPVKLSVEGVVEPEQVVHRLAACDVLLFVRNGISTRRGSAIAGIAAGLPVIAYPNSETAPPITDAGVVLVNPGDLSSLNEALVRVLSDAGFRAELSARSRAAYKAHFAWPAIAERYVALLNPR